MTAATAFLDGPQISAAEELKAQMQQLILAHEDARPRSQQTAIGPSGVGEACVRRLGYQLAGIRPVNQPDRWAAITGTAVHAMLEQAAAADPARWLTETRVQIDPTLGGSVDLYDRQLQRVIDHKASGATGMKRYRSHGPKPQQLVQINLYAWGMEQAGWPVREVALVYYPLGGTLDGIHSWVGPYDRQVAEDALDRLMSIKVLVAGLDIDDTHPERIALLPATTSSLCAWCPYYRYRSADPATGCPGASA